GMGDAFGNANNDIVEQEETTGNISSPLILGTKPKKRLTSKAKCSPGIQTQKRPKLHEHTSLPPRQKNTAAAISDPKQKKLPFLLSSYKKGSGTAAPDQKNLAAISTDKDKKNQGVDQDISHEELVKILAMHRHATRMVEQDDFGKLVAHLNPRTEELSYTILGAIGEWGLDDKVFSVILDDAFVDDSVASNLKASLQKRNKVATNQSLLVARYATHLLDELIQVGLDELDRVMERFTKCSRYQMDSTPSLVYSPNCRYAPSMEAWTKAQKICHILEDFHKHKDFVHKFPSPAGLFDKVLQVWSQPMIFNIEYFIIPESNIP
ncbi:hypothetical protein BAE44_0014940, partial [Dichanthelium oligosanthes]